jgi:signal transduction histidine kinase
LGLAIVHSICHAHGGNVTAESVIGKGSRFCVTLPLAERENSTGKIT